jgi:hypothetical protein
MARWAGVQKVSRPIVRCHEISQIAPIAALVAAISVIQAYRERVPARVYAFLVSMPPTASAM